MGVIDLDARVKKLEQGGGGADPTVINQIEADLTALDEQINGDGDTDLDLAGDVAELDVQINGDGENPGLAGNVATLMSGTTPYYTTITPTYGEANTGGCYYSVLGNIVHLHMDLKAVNTGASRTVFTMPATLRPRAKQVIPINVPGMSSTNAFINTDGTVTIEPVNPAFTIDYTYFINEVEAT